MVILSVNNITVRIQSDIGYIRVLYTYIRYLHIIHEVHENLRAVFFLFFLLFELIFFAV